MRISLQPIRPRFGSIMAGNPNDYQALLGVHSAIQSGGIGGPGVSPIAIRLWISAHAQIPDVVQALKQVPGFQVSTQPETAMFTPGPAYKYEFKGLPVAFCVDANEPVENIP